MIEQELIQAHLEYEELAQRVQRALWRLEHAKGDFCKTHAEGWYVVGDYVVWVDVWDGQRVAPVEVHPITPLKSEVIDDPSN